ncbi:hypothetical protein BXZ70DRAFT_1007856 [Cristinia sonorae]|uniref:Carboxylic ester hydrolase n=1 Tax=Cristinia sonorae TaxID=1940300 RepID=A0A8K0UNI9_9AGAR|nr:hypothetical protein BXZ70DRAFT_1007856 [Cristinia sonorae]
MSALGPIVSTDCSLCLGWKTGEFNKLCICKLRADSIALISLGGFGPVSFGGSSQAGNGFSPLKSDAEHDILAALVHWVEMVSPESITGTAYKNNLVAEGVAFTRPICKYPGTAVYHGGDVNSATSFRCGSG